MAKKLWKIPFLVAIGFLAWMVFLPRQFDSFTDTYLLLREERAKTAPAQNEEKKNSPIFSQCDDRLAPFQENRLIPFVAGCTTKLCQKEDPCCNTCFVHWKVEGTTFIIQRLKIGECQADGCRKLHNCPETLQLAEVSKDCDQD